MTLDNTPISIRLLIYHPTPSGAVLAVIGNHPALGEWREPQTMTLGPPRQLLSGVQGRCWEYVFTTSNQNTLEIPYRYLIIDTIAATAVWEREPNRTLRLPQDTIDSFQVYEVMDSNFVAGMTFDAVPPHLFLGPYPQLPEDVEALRAQGVTAVLNLQTEADIRLRRVDLDRLKGCYREAGISFHQLAIEDFNETDLVAKLPAALDLLKRLVDAGHQVYLHCTAGMGRSAALAVAYISVYHGKPLEEALAYVKHHRPVICPNLNALRRLLNKPL